MDFIEQYLRFIKEAERLKAVTRTAWTHDGRRESTAEHSPCSPGSLRNAFPA